MKTKLQNLIYMCSSEMVNCEQCNCDERDCLCNLVGIYNTEYEEDKIHCDDLD